jgi:citrate synthase
MKAVEEIGSPDRVKHFLDTELERAHKIMGMGHRIYKAKDPRAVVMQGFLEELSRRKEDFRYLEILKELERDFRARMEEKGKPLYPNVDFFSGAVYALLGIPAILYTPIFALSRVSGWLAHILEQRKDNKLYRPANLYTGPAERHYLPIGER